MYYDSFSSPESGLPKALLSPFFSAGTAIPYKKGQMIYLQGQDPEFMYCLKEGTVKTYIGSEDGEEKLLTTYRKGSIFGEASFFDGMPRVSSAIALTDCSIIPLNRETVTELFLQHPELASGMITYLARTVRLLSGHVDTMSFQSAGKRLAQLLINHPDAESVIHVTHEELSSALSVSRVTVSRLLGDFMRKGYLRTGYGTITLTDRIGLSRVN